MTNVLQILVDTDAGVDDTLAMFVLMQIAPASTIDIAVTFGNVPLEQAMSNVSLFSAISGFAPRKVLRGSSGPLRGEPRFAADVHGVDGLGGLTELPLWQPPPPRLCANVFDSTELDIYEKVIALGPLTDILRLTDSSSASPPLFIMGGAFDVKGNISPYAEFNFYSDPEAASKLLASYDGDIFIVPLDVCNNVVLGREYFGDLCDKNGTSTAAFLKLIHQHYMDFYQRIEGINGCHPHDTLAVYAAMGRDLFEWRRGRAQVVSDGTERGRSTFNADPSGRHYVAKNIDVARFFDLLEGTLEHFTQPLASK